MRRCQISLPEPPNYIYSQERGIFLGLASPIYHKVLKILGPSIYGEILFKMWHKGEFLIHPKRKQLWIDPPIDLFSFRVGPVQEAQRLFLVSRLRHYL